jgi:hypothetical protein
MNRKKADEAKERILGTVDDATHPKLMTKSEAIEWLSGLVFDIQIRQEALRDEMREEG